MKVAATRQLVVKSPCQMVLLPSTERSNTISQTTKTPMAIRPAAKMPQACETVLTALMNASMRECGVGAGKSPTALLFNRQGFVEQLLPVRHFLGVIGIGRLLGEREPDVELRIGQCHDLDVVVLECLDRLVVHGFRLGLVIGLGVLPGLENRRLLLLVERVEVLL